ncbi:hypothetical protein CR970_03050 [Candidatus Saccharibacteria bacterium]|nr:MAG: hypothetical protein CR970_03050 [Candidatus Saccharibacteria bacterium]
MEALLPNSGEFGDSGSRGFNTAEHTDGGRRLPKRLAVAMLAATTLLAGCGGEKADSAPDESVGYVDFQGDAGDYEYEGPPEDVVGESGEIDSRLLSSDSIPPAVEEMLPSVGLVAAISQDDKGFYNMAIDPVPSVNTKDGRYTSHNEGSSFLTMDQCPKDNANVVVYEGGSDAVTGRTVMDDQPYIQGTRSSIIDTYTVNYADTPGLIRHEGKGPDAYNALPEFVSLDQYPTNGSKVYVLSMDPSELRQVVDEGWLGQREVSELSKDSWLQTGEYTVVPAILSTRNPDSPDDNTMPDILHIAYYPGTPGTIGGGMSPEGAIKEGGVVVTPEGKVAGFVNGSDFANTITAGEFDELYDVQTTGYGTLDFLPDQELGLANVTPATSELAANLRNDGRTYGPSVDCEDN